MKIDLDKYEKFREEMNKINQQNITDLEFYRSGKKIKVEKELLSNWHFTGLNNISFIQYEIINKYQSKEKLIENN